MITTNAQIVVRSAAENKKHVDGVNKYIAKMITMKGVVVLKQDTMMKKMMICLEEDIRAFNFFFIAAYAVQFCFVNFEFADCFVTSCRKFPFVVKNERVRSSQLMLMLGQ